MPISSSIYQSHGSIMMGARVVFALFVLLVDGVFGDDVVTVKEGDSVPLNTGVTKQQHDKMMWYFNDTRIAQINGKPSKSCLYDGEGGIFSGRLEVAYETGSLTITNIGPEHTGRYVAELIRSNSSGTSTSLNRNSKCDSTKITRKISTTHNETIKTFIVTVVVANPDKTNKEFQMTRKELETDMIANPDKPNKEFQMTRKELETAMSSGLSAGVVAGISVVVLLVFVAAAVGVIYSRRRSSRKDGEKNNQGLLFKV